MVVEISNMFDISPALTDRSANYNRLKPTMVNNGPDSPKIPSY